MLAVKASVLWTGCKVCLSLGLVSLLANQFKSFTAAKFPYLVWRFCKCNNMSSPRTHGGYNIYPVSLVLQIWYTPLMDRLCCPSSCSPVDLWVSVLIMRKLSPPGCSSGPSSFARPQFRSVQSKIHWRTSESPHSCASSCMLIIYNRKTVTKT